MNSVIDLGFMEIHWYSIMLFIGILVGSNLAIKEAKRHGMNENKMVDLLFLAIIFGILGARVYYVLFNLDYYTANPNEIFKVWEGGLAIHGGIIAALVCISIFCYQRKINLLKILDYLVPSLILAQAIGRWGNFFNGEAHGAICSLEFLQSIFVPDFVINGMYINGNYYLPTFYFESLWCLFGFILMIVLRSRKFNKVGFLTGFYFVWYGFERFFVEGLRTDSLMFLGFKIAQIVSILMVLVGIVIFVYSFKKKKDYKDMIENV